MGSNHAAGRKFHPDLFFVALNDNDAGDATVGRAVVAQRLL